MRWGTAVGIAALAAACSDEVTLTVEPPWSKDQLVVLVVLDSTGAPIDSSPMVFGGDEAIELDLRPNTTSRVFARTFSANLRGPNGEPASRCGIAFSSSNPLPNPEGSFISPPIDSDSTAIELIPEDGTFSASIPLGFSGCAQINDCAGYSATLLAAPPMIESRHVALVDRSLIYFSGKQAEAPDNDPLVIGRIRENDAVDFIQVGPELTSKTDDLTWDPRGWMWLIRAAGGGVFRYDRDFRPLSRPNNVRVTSVHVGRDGTTYLRNKEGELLIPTITATATFLSKDLTVPAAIKKVEVVRRERIFAHVDRSIHYFDGQTWVVEHQVSLLENLSGMGADDEVAVFVGEIELVRLRDENTGEWNLLPRPFDSGLRLHSVVGAGGGRFLAVGELGSVAVWTGSYWCPFGLGSGAALDDVSIDASNTVAYAVADQELGIDDATVLVRIELPPP